MHHFEFASRVCVTGSIISKCTREDAHIPPFVKHINTVPNIKIYIHIYRMRNTRSQIIQIIEMQKR